MVSLISPLIVTSDSHSSYLVTWPKSSLLKLFSLFALFNWCNCPSTIFIVSGSTMGHPREFFRFFLSSLCNSKLIFPWWWELAVPTSTVMLFLPISSAALKRPNVCYDSFHRIMTLFSKRGTLLLRSRSSKVMEPKATIMVDKHALNGLLDVIINNLLPHSHRLCILASEEMTSHIGHWFKEWMASYGLYLKLSENSPWTSIKTDFCWPLFCLLTARHIVRPGTSWEWAHGFTIFTITYFLRWGNACDAMTINKIFFKPKKGNRYCA